MAMARSNNQTVFFNLLLLLSFVVIGIGVEAKRPVGAAKKPVCLMVYGVENGDTCYAVAGKYLKGNLAGLSAINPNINCDNLFVGQWVCVVGQA